MNFIYNFKYVVRYFIGRSYLLTKLLFKRKDLIVNHNSDLIIEGFPRSANTFFTLLTQKLYPNLQIAHHLHVSSQILYGVKNKKPVIILIRKPDQVVESLLMRDNKLKNDFIFLAFYLFYKPLVNLNSNKICIIQFDDFIENEKIIGRFLFKYFSSPKIKLTPDIKKQINDRIKELGRSNKRLTKIGYSLPSPEKEAYKRTISKVPTFNFTRNLAESVFEQIVDKIDD